jgi:hypothetical protein
MPDQPRTKWGQAILSRVEDLAEDMAKLKAEVAALRQDFSEFRAESRVDFGLLKWVGGLLGGVLLLATLGAVYSAGRMAQQVEVNTRAIQELKA